MNPVQGVHIWSDDWKPSLQFALVWIRLPTALYHLNDFTGIPGQGHFPGQMAAKGDGRFKCDFGRKDFCFRGRYFAELFSLTLRTWREELLLVKLHFDQRTGWSGLNKLSSQSKANRSNSFKVSDRFQTLRSVIFPENKSFFPSIHPIFKVELIDSVSSFPAVSLWSMSTPLTMTLMWRDFALKLTQIEFQDVRRSKLLSGHSKLWFVSVVASLAFLLLYPISTWMTKNLSRKVQLFSFFYFSIII